MWQDHVLRWLSYYLHPDMWAELIVYNSHLFRNWIVYDILLCHFDPILLSCSLLESIPIDSRASCWILIILEVHFSPRLASSPRNTDTELHEMNSLGFNKKKVCPIVKRLWVQIHGRESKRAKLAILSGWEQWHIFSTLLIGAAVTNLRASCTCRKG